MKKFVIEREFPGAGDLSAEELQEISQKSVNVIHEMGPTIQWVQSYVTDDKIYCVYVARDEAMLREHAKLAGFPINLVSEVSSMIEPRTAGRDFLPGQ